MNVTKNLSIYIIFTMHVHGVIWTIYMRNEKSHEKKYYKTIDWYTQTNLSSRKMNFLSL